MAQLSSQISKENISLVHHVKNRSLNIEPVPFTLSPGHHLIKIAATALTSGELLWPEPASLPFPVPGFDVAGTILNEVPGSPFKPGDRIYAGNETDRPGAARQYTEALPAELAAVPANLSWDEAASMPLSALTAWQALFTHAGLAFAEVLDQSSSGGGGAGRSSDGGNVERSDASGSGSGRSADKVRVLVTAASGGVGLWAVQLAKLAGAYVVATCGTGNVDVVRGLGADEVLDYRRTGVAEWVAVDRQRRIFDVVIDCVGGKVLEECWTVVRECGFLNSVAEPADARRPVEGVAKDVRSLWFIYKPIGEQLAKITKLVEAGKCRPLVDSAWDFEEYGQAFAKVNAGHVTGKVVLRAPKD